MGVVKGRHLLENRGRECSPGVAPKGSGQGSWTGAACGRGVGVRGCESLPPYAGAPSGTLVGEFAS